MNTKWIVVTGGVISGIGKGTAVGAIGKLLSDFKVVPIKCDGYLNVDPGTMNPYQHGEVFVLDDGGEVDLDFGHYERFIGISCKKEWNLTSGKMFEEVIRKERRGDYLGGTVQVIPHFVDLIKDRFMEIAEKEKAEIVLIEIGGTIGDIENAWFVEAVNQLKANVGQENIMYVHLTYVPFVVSLGEPKTKPAQRDVQTLREKGIIPDIIIARSEGELSEEIKSKLAMFCGVDKKAVIGAKNIEKSVYEIPLNFEREGLLNVLSKKLRFEPKNGLIEWRKLVEKIKNPSNEINAVICGKYVNVKDAYISIKEALMHAGAHLSTKINISYVETTDLDEPDVAKEAVKQKLKSMDAIIVPIGFGSRGAEGKIKCIQYARENKIPFLGLCFGLQLAIAEFARNVCGLEEANSTEINPKTKNPVIDLLPEQTKIKDKGATMRLGAYKAELKEGTTVQKLYGASTAEERHRHRWEVNPEYHKALQEAGMIFSGTSRNGKLVEFIELSKHPYFVATQAHPEYKSRLEKPSPLFYGLVKAALGTKK